LSKVEGSSQTTTVLENLQRIFETLHKSLTQLDYLWEKYFDSARRALGEWYLMRSEIEQAIASLKSLENYYNEKLREFEVKKEIGLLSEEEYDSFVKTYGERLSEVKEQLSEIQNRLSVLSARIEEHLRRILSEAVGGDIQERIELLEKMRSEGKISEEAYKRLKDELERLISQI